MWTGCVDTRKVNVAQAWAEGMARARARFVATGLFDLAELDLAAIAACGITPDGGALIYPTVLMPNGVRVSAQLPPQPQPPA